MFKKDDYIVIIKDGHYLFPIGYCFKQREKYEYIRVEKSKEGIPDGLPRMSYDSGCWRFATQNEIDEYNKYNKPFDVTLLNNYEIY